MRSITAFALRLLARVALATWFGGFTFYAAVVVPDLHETFGGMETGEVSRRVAPFLYYLGAAALGLSGAILLTDRSQWAGWRGKARFGLVAANAAFLLAIYLMHRSLEGRLDSGNDLPAFRSFHEVYLTVWTGQWLAILSLVGLDALPPPPKSGD